MMQTDLRFGSRADLQKPHQRPMNATVNNSKLLFFKATVIKNEAPDTIKPLKVGLGV